jgi:DNA-binding CsgD family transcriptional regulator
VSSFLLPLLPQHLRDLFERKRESDGEAESPAEDAGAPAEAWYALTRREREVTALVYMGHRNYQIAEVLGVSYGTVQTHLQHIYDKFGLRSRKELRRSLAGWPAEAWWADTHR